METIIQHNFEIRNELMRYIIQIFGNEYDTEDLVQETFLTSLEKENSLKSQDAYKQWVFRIARNKSIDFLKRNHRFKLLK